MWNEFLSQHPSLPSLWAETWRILHQEAVFPGHPWYTASLSTQSGEGPEARTVVLRMADKEKHFLVCHSDSRAGKVAQIRRQPAVHWLFWDAANSVQLRASGLASLHHGNEQAREAWAQLPALTKGNMSAALPPGTPVGEPETGISAYTRHPEITEAENEAWFRHFVVIETQVLTMDWLWISRNGHRRARIDYRERRPLMQWLVP